MSPWGLLLHLSTKTQPSHPIFSFPKSVPIKTQLIPGWPPAYVIHGTARTRSCTIHLFFFLSYSCCLLLSPPLGLLQKELLGATLPREPGCP